MNKPLPSVTTTAAGAPAAAKPWAVTAAKIEAAVERIATAIRPVRILAFGSRARGDAVADSDQALPTLALPLHQLNDYAVPYHYDDLAPGFHQKSGEESGEGDKCRSQRGRASSASERVPLVS